MTITKNTIALEHGNEFYKEHFVIGWTYFNLCNYSCSYCLPSLYNGSNRGPTLEVAKEFIGRVFKKKKNKKIFFEFTGGEITHLKHFTELFTYIKSLGGATGIISNASRSLEWWRDHSHLIDHACLSFHAEKGDQQHFYNVVAAVAATSSVHVNIMMLPNKFNELFEFAKKLAAEIEGISVAVQPLFHNFTGPMLAYSEQELTLMKNPDLPFGQNILYPSKIAKTVYRGEMKQLNRDGSSDIVDPTLLISRGENTWPGWQCYAGVENLIISMEGYIAKAICGIEGIIGHIADPAFIFPENPVTCNRSKCRCAFDIMSTKKNDFLVRPRD